MRNPKNNPRLSKFDFVVDYDDRYDTYYFNQNNNRISGDMLGLTMEISARHSYSLFKRLNPEQANYSKYESAYLFDQICSKTAFEKLWKGFAQAQEDALADEVGKTHRNLVGPTLAGTQYHYLAAQLLELLGFDAANELILELRKDEIDRSGETYYSALSHQGFFAGEESLNSLLGFLMLHQLAHGDSEVKSVLHHSQMDKMDSLYELTWGLTGKAKESAFSSIRSAEDYEFYYFSRFLEDLRLNSDICPLLIERALK
ncbi:hypothetical protein [Pseudobacteriovorax antillogorgiicola]|uniref:Uncharacterized protein n=1 Tax=Pseudobacteriovorax antillogorgiicola TaxID=1513793 RepID=A0A1Y6CPT6_9BACT|nr:hypothetical protein [Pseudobacteriovorax antillogorgiicola]TCS46959.1 hypothetical protein EDD56_12254 [Pseudobacteriovorax antillogorgiicola]SMF64554.1 hypothetical protein SAMN06296036_12254 [Pseudobacteriovorax antillogorgiicola]